MGAYEHALARRLWEGVHDVPGVTVYGGWPVAPECCGSIVALNVDGLDSAEVADALSSGWGIACRAGAHCAPLMHRALGTERQGIVRLSCGWFNTEDSEIARRSRRAGDCRGMIRREMTVVYTLLETPQVLARRLPAPLQGFVLRGRKGGVHNRLSVHIGRSRRWAMGQTICELD